MDYKKIGKKIACERIKLNLTQTALAEKLTISSKTVSKWESGIGLPSIEFLPELAKIFNITIDELLCKAEQKRMTLNEELNAMAIFRILSPNYANYPEGVKEQLKEDWLNLILKDEGVELSEYYDFINNKCKPKSMEDCVKKLFTMDIVSNSRIQKRLRIGYPKAVKIRAKLIEKDLIDEDNYEWLKKDADKVLNILNTEIRNISQPEIKEPEIEVDILKTILVNDNLTDKQKSEALQLLDECSADNHHPCTSVLFCLQRETVECSLIMADYTLNLEIYNLDSLVEFKTKVKEPIADQVFVVLESSAETDILDVMSIYNFKIKTELAVKINNELGKRCKITLFYVKYEE